MLLISTKAIASTFLEAKSLAINYYEAGYQAGLIQGKEAQQRIEKQKLELMQLRANRFNQLKTECLLIEKNWGTASVYDRTKCTAVKEFIYNGKSISDEILFGP